MSNLSVNMTNSTTLPVSGIGDIIPYVMTPVFFATLIWQCYVVVKLLTKYWHKMEPVHILEFNILICILAVKVTSAFGLGIFNRFIKGWSFHCIALNIIQNYARFCSLGDICASQINMLLMIHLNSSYKEYVTNRDAIIAAIVVKLLMFIPLGLLIGYDFDHLNCSSHNIPLCAYLKKNNFFWITIPVISTFIVIIGVFVGVSISICKLEYENPNQVHPLATISGGLQQNNSGQVRN